MIYLFLFKVDLDSTEFSAGQAGSLLAALVQRRNAMVAAAVAQNQASASPLPPQTGYNLMSQVNGSLPSMMHPGVGNMVGQQRPMAPLSPMGIMRGQLSHNMGDISPSGVISYGNAAAARNGQGGGKNTMDSSQKSVRGYQQVMNEGLAGRDIISSSWPHQGVLPRPLQEGDMTAVSTTPIGVSRASQMESAAPGMYSGMRTTAGPPNIRGTAPGFPYYQ